MDDKNDKAELLDGAAGAPAPAADPPPPPDPGRKPGVLRLAEFKRLYAWLFLLVLILAAAVVYVTVKWAKAPSSDQNGPTQSLSAQQLAALAANTTNVGTSSQTLNIQSNTIFDNQVLLRQDLQVAGSIKVGGSLTLPSITVGGTSTLSRLAVSSTLSVAGNTTVQGQLTVEKSLNVAGAATFTNLSASRLNVSNLQLAGDLTISRHLLPSGGNPGKSNGGSLGSGGTASVNGGDSAGTVTINTGGSPSSGCFINVTFAHKFSATPHIVISPANRSGAGLSYYTTRTTSGFSICSANTPSSSTTYIYDYVAFD